MTDLGMIANYRFVEPDYRRTDGGAWWPITDPTAVASVTERLTAYAEETTLAAVRCAQAGHTRVHAGVQCDPTSRRCEARAQVARSEVPTTARTLLIKGFVDWFDPPVAGVAIGADPGSPG